MKSIGKALKGFIQIYGVVAIAATALWTITRDSGARDSVCPTISHYYGHQLFCGRGYEAIPARQAEDTLFTYFEHADASGFDRGWDLLDPQLQRAPEYKGDMKAYGESVHDTLWGETIQAPDHGEGLNQFIAHVRVYRLDGDVIPYAIPITLHRNSDGRVLITHIANGSPEGEGQRQPYSWAYLKKPTSLHARPRQNSDLTLLAQDELQTGENPRLRALCEVDLAQGSPNPHSSGTDWWTLTNQGWIENADLVSEGQPAGILGCSEYVEGR